MMVAVHEMTNPYASERVDLRYKSSGVTEQVVLTELRTSTEVAIFTVVLKRTTPIVIPVFPWRQGIGVDIPLARCACRLFGKRDAQQRDN